MTSTGRSLPRRRVLLVGHPGPHDLARVGTAVGAAGRSAAAGAPGRTARRRGSRKAITESPPSVLRSWCAGPGAPHGAWPLEAASFGTRGCHGPARGTTLQAGRHLRIRLASARACRPAPACAACSSWSARVIRREADTSEAYDEPPSSDGSRGTSCTRPAAATRANAAARNKRVGEVADHHAAEHLVDEGAHLVGAGRLDDPGDDLGHRDVRPAAVELVGRGAAGRRTPSCGAGRGATARRPGSRPPRRTRARPGSRALRSRRGAPPARPAPRRPGRGHRGRGRGRPGRRPR